MAEPTYEELLEILKTAIKTRMEGGAVKSYSISGRNIQYAELDELRAMLKDLETKVAGKKSNTTYARFDNPS
ncbi:MAG TPA: hypothetical protein PLV52_01680 [Candidatus Omnitrophota bacterium]|nr:hypothetical protein [Candidatus Omnitrophota bacterium]